MAQPAAPPPEAWPQVRLLFEQLVDADEATRPSLLQHAAVDHPVVAREAEALLAEHLADCADEARGSDFLAPSIARDQVAQMALEDAAGRQRSGQRLGPWRLSSLLGEGGMGQVWEAFRADGRYDARVAIKVIRPGAHAAGVLERFALEQRTLARLNHPHIARLLDAGRTDDGAPYFVLEAVQGRPLDAACIGLDLRQRVRLMLQLVDAVAYAHRHLLVHRDLKPGNVMVTDDGQVKLLDFGIAQAIAGPAETEGALLGLTPAYASPEQVRGAPVGTATDIYALGLLLHRVLTGTHAYGREARDTASALRAVLEATPTPPSAAPRDAADPGVPRAALRGDIDAIVARCVQKSPEARYPSADALAADLRAWLDGRDVSAAPPSAWRSLRKLLRRQWAVSAAIGLALVVLILGLVAQAGQARDATAAVAAMALLALAAGLGASAWQARKAAAARDHALLRLNDARQIARDIVMRYADTITYLPGGAQLKASLLTDTIAHLERLAQWSGGSHEDAALAGDVALACARLADVQGVDSDLTLDDPAACRRHCERALELFPRGEAAHRDDPRYLMWWARTMATLSRVVRSAGDADAALRWRERQRDLLQLGATRFPGERDLRHELGSALVGIGQAYDTWSRVSLEEPVKAALAFEQALAVYEQLAASDARDSVAHHQLGVVHGSRMLSLMKQARMDEAIASGQRGLVHKRQALALEPGHVAYRQGLAGESSNLALVLNEARRFTEAREAAQVAVDVMRALEQDDPGLATWGQRRRHFSLHLGRAQLGCGDAEAALQPLRDSLEGSQGALTGAPQRRRGLNQLLMAQALAVTAQTGPALAALGAARKDLDGALAQDPDDAEACTLMAELLWLATSLPGCVDARANLGQAQSLLARAAQRAPQRPHARWVSLQVNRSLGLDPAAAAGAAAPASGSPPPAPWPARSPRPAAGATPPDA